MKHSACSFTWLRKIQCTYPGYPFNSSFIIALHLPTRGSAKPKEAIIKPIVHLQNKQNSNLCSRASVGTFKTTYLGAFNNNNEIVPYFFSFSLKKKNLY